MKQSSRILKCTCGYHGIEVVGNTYGIFVSFWYEGKQIDSFWKRLKTAWQIIRGIYLSFDEIILTDKNVETLKNMLDSALKERLKDR